jgi:hypothetical protein
MTTLADLASQYNALATARGRPTVRRFSVPALSAARMPCAPWCRRRPRTTTATDSSLCAGTPSSSTHWYLKHCGAIALRGMSAMTPIAPELMR